MISKQVYACIPVTASLSTEDIAWAVAVRYFECEQPDRQFIAQVRNHLNRLVKTDLVVRTRSSVGHPSYWQRKPYTDRTQTQGDRDC